MGTQWAQIALLLQLSSVVLADVDFTFLIVAVSRKVIKIKFEWLSLWEDAVCANESLSVLDGAARANALVVLCGTSMPSVSFKSTQSNLTLVLRSTGPLVACGKTSDWRNFPWDVQLFFNSRFAANGTIIGRRYSDGVFHSVGIISVHNRFNTSTHDYNVAVVELSKAVPFSDAANTAQSLVCREEDDRWYVTGLASWGNQCNYPPARAYPGVFTRVYKFLGFIEDIAN
ncbi:unnamed protein product [Lampetra planeri]